MSSWVASATTCFKAGTYEDWIFGGPGNDVLSGGFDRQAGDLIWGEAGDDIYQVVTDRLPATKYAQRRVGPEGNETLIPTYSDRFDGGTGRDQVLYLGGDLDANGRPVPDHVAMRWNTILHRYEMTSRVWNYQAQQWLTDNLDSTGMPVQYFAFYTVFDQENTTTTLIDTRRGDDEVHADPEYVILGSEWGIDPEDRSQRAKVDLEIRGGDGNDRLFGGAGNDKIFGGNGADVIRGGGGDDEVDGGSGDDWLAGGPDQIMPDRYEYLGGAANNIVAYASRLSEDFTILNRRNDQGQLLAENDRNVAIRNLNLGQGDPGDWYYFKTPSALRSVNASTAAQVLKSAINLKWNDAEIQVPNSPGRNVLTRFGYDFATGLAPRQVFLFAGVDTDPSDQVAVAPVERYEGVPAYYLVHVVNPNSLAVVGVSPITPPDLLLGEDIRFSISLNGGLSRTITVPNLLVNGQSVAYTEEGLRSTIQNRINAEFGSNSIYVDYISTQDRRIGLWLIDENAFSLSISSVESPAFAKLHLVSNTVRVGEPNLQAPSMGDYELVFRSADLGATTAIDSTSATDAVVVSENTLDRPVAIPLGDIDGDGYDDFVGSRFTGSSNNFARIYFGGPLATVNHTEESSIANRELNSHLLTQQSLTLQLPSRLIASPYEATDSDSFSRISSGDFNSDGLSDIVVTSNAGPQSGVYVILGRADGKSVLGRKSLVGNESLVQGTTFWINVNREGWKQVTISSTANFGGLIAALNLALANAGIAEMVRVETLQGSSSESIGDRLQIRLLQGDSLVLSQSANNPMQLLFGFADGDRNYWSNANNSPYVLDITQSADVMIRTPGVTTAARGLLVGNAFGLASSEGNPQAEDIIANLGSNIRVYPGNNFYRSTNTLWSADFVDARGNANDETIAEATGLWHRTTRRSSGAGSTNPSFYYGRESQGNYEGPIGNGVLTTETINLKSEINHADSNDLLLRFSYFLQTEKQPNYDIANVTIERWNGTNWVDGGIIASNQTANSLNDRGPSGNVAPNAVWDLFSVSLSEFRGELIRLKFKFDQGIDNLANNYEGWYIDDLRIERVTKSVLANQGTLLGQSGLDIFAAGDNNGDGYADVGLLRDTQKTTPMGMPFRYSMADSISLRQAISSLTGSVLTAAVSYLV